MTEEAKLGANPWEIYHPYTLAVISISAGKSLVDLFLSRVLGIT
jgi:hypothetical protein